MKKHKKAVLVLGVIGLTGVFTGYRAYSDSEENVESTAHKADIELSETETDKEETDLIHIEETEEKSEKEEDPTSAKEEVTAAEDVSKSELAKTEETLATDPKEDKEEAVTPSSSDTVETDFTETEKAEKKTPEVSPEETVTAEKSEKKPETKKITFNKDARIPVTPKLLPSDNSTERTEEVTHVLVHFASNALTKPTDPYRVDDLYTVFKDYGVSAHYVIDRKGEIHLFVEEDRVAYHAGKGELSQYPEYKDVLNYHSIGIELLAMGTREEMIPIISEQQFNKVDPSQLGYTDSQYTSLKALIDDIAARHPSIKKDRQHIIGHDEYAPGRKTDPGSLFDWSKIGF